MKRNGVQQKPMDNNLPGGQTSIVNFMKRESQGISSKSNKGYQVTRGEANENISGGKFKQKTIKQMLTFLSSNNPRPRETLTISKEPKTINCFGDLNYNKGLQRQDKSNDKGKNNPNPPEPESVNLRTAEVTEPKYILKRIQGSHLTQPTEEGREQASV